MKRIVAVDFFCGAGGLTRGLQNAGIEVLFGVDSDAEAKHTYSENNGVRFVNTDIRDLSYAALNRMLLDHIPDYRKNAVLVFAGCAPCQPFSKINKSATNSDKVDLLIRFGQFIERFKPQFVISENVPQIVHQRKVFNKFLNLLRGSGYQYSYELLNAKNFGVPQTRLRLVLLASRIGEITMPQCSASIKTVRDAIARFPRLEAGESHRDVPNHSTMNLSAINLARIQATPLDGGDSRSWPTKMLPLCHKRSKGYYDVYGRMSWDKPAPTLTTRCISYSNGRFGHPEQERAISLREAAALQSFPDEYVFYGSQTLAARHVGNAVPPELAAHLGLHIIQAYQQSLVIET